MMEPSMSLSGGGAASASTRRTRRTSSKTDSPSTPVSAFVPTRTNMERKKETKYNTQHHAVSGTTHDAEFEKLKPNEIQENLYNLPDSVSPTYQTIPFFTKAFICLFSTFMSMRSWRLQSIISLGAKYKISGEMRLFKFIIKFITMSLATTFIAQESFYSPSRIDTSTLIQRQWLPSPLSKFATVSTSISPQLLSHKEKGNGNPLNIGPLNTHYLSYQPFDQNKKCNFDCIHFNHGFGASSLSWLPVIPSLAKKMNAKVAIAHDSPGFGLTERPKILKVNSLTPYTSAGSAMIGNSLLLNEIKYNQTNNDNSTIIDENKRVALFGHSMGCAATLRMALCLPHDVKKVVVLVAPALLGSLPSPTTSTATTSSILDDNNIQGNATKNAIIDILKRQPIKIRSWLGLFISALRSVILDAPVMLVLKRLVG